MKLSISGSCQQSQEGEKKCLNSELWHACAGPLVCLPTLDTRVVYFPQGHSEQVSASTNRVADGPIPNYPNLPPQLICQLHNVTMHADVETDEVYAQMTLQPLSLQEQKESYFPTELGLTSKQPTNYFCKTLTASDTSTHGGFSVPRRAAEKVFPPLDFSQQPPAQELVARDLHDVEWKFRHIFRGQPKRHLLTTGWSVFVSAKRLVAGDSVIFIWNEKNQLLLGIRRASRPQTATPSSVLSSDSMHIGLLAAAAHAASTASCFTIFYNPRASPSEFVIPLSKYLKAVFHTHVAVGMRFRMFFETEESSVRRYMGTITGIDDLDPIRWPNSYWRTIKVGWDESTAGERQPRVSLWEIEPLTSFPMYPSLFPLRLKRPWYPDALPLHDNCMDEANRFMFLQDNSSQGLQPLNFQALGSSSFVESRFNQLLPGNEQSQYQTLEAAVSQDISRENSAKELISIQQPFYASPQLFRSSPLLQQSIIQYGGPQQNLLPQTHGEGENPLYGFLPHQQTFQILNSQAQKQQAPLLNELGQESLFLGSSSLSSSGADSMPTVVNSLEGGATLPTFSSSQSMMTQHEQAWAPKFSNLDVELLPPFSEKDQMVEPDKSSANSQAHTLFGFNIGSPLLYGAVVNSGSNALDENESIVQYPSSSYRRSIYDCADESTNLLQSVQNVEPSSKTFVKVYKSGSIGRSLDISRFASYDKLRMALGQMYGIEEELEDPLRSGWQLVFVDRENDVLLLGDDPWEEFVNNVWYIKILSPEDVQKLGRQHLKF